MNATRSGTPKVMGILMIIFAALGLLGTISSFGGVDVSGLGDEMQEKFSSVNSIMTVLGVVGLGLGVLHLVAGISAVGYKQNAPKLAKMYGITALALVVINLVVAFMMLQPLMDEVPGLGSAMGGLFIVFGLVGAVWPILVLTLMNSSKAKMACTN